MIKNLRKMLPYFFQMMDWEEIINGVVCILLGMAFSYHYGYLVYWQEFLHVSIWYLFYKLGVYCLDAIFYGEWEKTPPEKELGRLSPAEFREIRINFFWILAILFIAMSSVPLVQMIASGRLNHLTLIIVALIYLSDLLFLLYRSREFLSGFRELFYGFITAILIPSLYFSLSRDYLKISLLMITFPLFLQLIAWKICSNLEAQRKGRRISAGSLLERLDALNALSVCATLLLIGSLTVFLDRELNSIWTQLTILPVGLASAWLVYRSIKKEDPNWDWAILLVRVLPVFSALLLAAALWHH